MPGQVNHYDMILTKREKEVVVMIAFGHTVKEIADRLCLSDETVKCHIHNIYRKIDGHKESDIARYYFLHDYITAPPMVRKTVRLFQIAFEPNLNNK